MNVNCLSWTLRRAAGFQYKALASSAPLTNALPREIALAPAPRENTLLVPPSP
jgi:hypothetical protein